MDLAGYTPTLNEVASLFGKSSRWISDLRAKGELPGDGATLAEFVAAWTSINAAGGKGKSLDQHKARLAAEKADEAAMKNAERRRELLPSALVNLAVQGAFSRVRAKLLSLPSKCAPAISSMKSAVAIQEKLTELVHEALAELAGMANTVARTLRRGYELAPRTFASFCRQSSVPDFREVSRVALSDISAMQQVAEGAEYQYATVGDSAEKYTVGKWGQIISLTWETIINDDLSAFDRIPQAMGQEAAQVEGDVVYAILLSNPLMSDGVPLFHANHGNLAAAGSNIGIDSLQAGRTAMRTQRAPKGRFTSATPAHRLEGDGMLDLEGLTWTIGGSVA